MWYDEEFYDEPSEFEKQIYDFKQSLVRSVKSEFLEEMERLREENKNLQGIKEHFEQIKRDYERKRQECERTMREAEQKAKCMRVNELMEHFKIFAWGTTWECLYGPKCDKCNKNRQIKVILPSGKTVKDACECAMIKAEVMLPRRVILYEIADRDYGIVAWYKACGVENERYYNLDYASSMFSERMIEPGTSFDKVEKIKNQWEVMFSTIEECRAYCEYINEKNGVTSDILYQLNGDIYANEMEE